VYEVIAMKKVVFDPPRIFWVKVSILWKCAMGS